MVKNFTEFCNRLLSDGFSMGGGSDKGIYAIVPYSWENQDDLDVPAKWHTGDPDTDPWEWRMRVLEERDDILYGKVFFNSSGFITREWYPYFYAVRRGGEVMDEAEFRGTVNPMEKLVYDAVERNGETAAHELKALVGVTKENSTAFDKAVLSLQTRLFITMCGRRRKVNKKGESYGWNSAVYVTTEKFWADRNFSFADENESEAYLKIKEQVKKLNPFADEKKIDKFIRG